MADPRLLYAFPSDDWIHSLVPTFVVGAPDANFPYPNLFDDNPANPFMTPSTALTLQWDRTIASPGGLVNLIHWNVQGAATWLRSDDVAFGTFETYAFTVGVKDTEGYYPGLWVDTSGGPDRRYERLALTGNTDNLIGGALKASAITRVFPHHVSLGSQWGAHRPRIAPIVTAAEVQMGMRSYGRRRHFAGTVLYDQTVADAVDAWQQATGGIDLATPIVPKDTTLSDSWLVRWNTANSADYLYTDVETGIRSLLMGFIEVAKGRPWGTI